MTADDASSELPRAGGPSAPSPRPSDPEAEAAALQARVRRRVMLGIAQDSTARHTTVRADAGGWHTFLPGIERRVLHESAGTMSYLLRFAAGAVLPAHHHPQPEECLVISGVLNIGSDLALRAGDFHVAHADLPHASLASASGAVIFLRGASPKPDMLI